MEQNNKRREEEGEQRRKREGWWCHRCTVHLSNPLPVCRVTRLISPHSYISGPCSADTSSQRAAALAGEALFCIERTPATAASLTHLRVFFFFCFFFCCGVTLSSKERRMDQRRGAGGRGWMLGSDRGEKKETGQLVRETHGANLCSLGDSGRNPYELITLPGSRINA